MKKIFILFFLLITASPALAGIFSASDFIDACPVYDDFAAVYSPADYTVTYSCGDATGTPPVAATATYKSDFSAATNTCTKSGYTFVGWRVSGTNDVKFPGASFEWDYTENKTLTAVWLAEDWQTGTTRFVNACPVYNDFVVVFAPKQHTCNPGYYLPANTDGCIICPANSYCAGGTYTFNVNVAQGITSCGTGLYSPAGMWESSQCGRILHIGDEVVYLRSVKKTTPSLHIDIDSDGVADYFGNMTTLDVPMTNGTERKLKISFGGQTYSVYDDSVDISLYEN